VAIHLGDVASSFLPNSCSLYGARPTLDGNGNGNGTSRAHLFDRPRQIFNLHPPCSSVATADVIRICIAHTHTSPHAVGRRGVGSTQKQRWRAARDREREGWGAQRAAPWGRERASSLQPRPIRTAAGSSAPNGSPRTPVSASQRPFGGL
jgi:hypothetical protein